MAYGDLKVNNLIYDTGSGDATRSVVSIPLTASPTFTGTPAAPTAAANTNTTQIATTAFVMTELGDYLLTATAASTYAPLASPTFTGSPTVPGYAALSGATFTGTVNGTSLVLSADLTVNGTTTTINTTNLDVEDKNITLGKVSSPSDTTADGGGITLKGASDKTFNWVDATDAWTSSEHIITAAGKRINIGTTTEGNSNADNLTIEDSANAGLTIRSGTSNQGSIYFSDATSGVGEYMGMLVFNHSDNTYKTYVNNVLSQTIDSSGNTTFGGTVTDSKGNLRSIPNLSKTSAHTLVASDAGKTIYISTGGVTVPDSVMAAGDAVTIVNNSGSDQTITQGSNVALYNSADASTGNRTLAGRGMATIWFHSTGTCYISGAGLS